MSSEELEVIVNFRRFQQDYIGDYIADLWLIDQPSFWKHVGKTFDLPEGVLIYDNDSHFRVMASNDMPINVWKKMLRSLIRVHRTQLEQEDDDFPLSTLMEILWYQTSQASGQDQKRQAMLKWIKALPPSDQHLAVWFVQTAFNCKLPKWFKSALKE